MRVPEPLRDATLGVFAPASGFDPDRFGAGCKILEDLGFSLVVHPQTRLRTGYLAGSDEARAAAFAELLADPEVDALIAARGGYGVHRLLPLLDPDALVAAGKPIIGFSDLTALHALAQRAGLVSFHGPVVTQLADLRPEDHRSLVRALAGDWSATLEASATISPGRVEGPLIGGCLSVLTPLVGTPYLPPVDGAILLLEDVQEAPYRVDRQLTHLALAGILDRVAGVAVGEFVRCDPPRASEPTIEEVLAERLGGRDIPVVAGLPFGHGARNLTLPLGARATLDADRRTLTIERRT